MAETAEGEQSVETPEPTELVEKVAGDMEKVFGEEVSTDEPKPKAEKKDEKPETTPKKEEGEEDEVESEPESEPEPKKKEAVAAAKTDAPTLPAAYRRAAKYYGMTDEEVDDLFKSSPELALKHFGKQAASMQAETAQWSALGREKKAALIAEQKRQQEEAARTGRGQADPFDIKPVDVEGLIKKYGNDELIRDLVGPLNATIEALRPLISTTMENREYVQGVKRTETRNTIDEFFSHADLKPFVDLYGVKRGELSPEQAAKRDKVLEIADEMMMGAQVRNQRISLHDALNLAHDVVSAGHKTIAARTELKKGLKTRADGVALRPSRRGSEAGDGTPKDEAELVARTKGRLAKIFQD
jgi:hypothetical protein